MDDLPKGERQMLARARHAFTRLVGLERGDELADELYEARIKPAPPSPKG